MKYSNSTFAFILVLLFLIYSGNAFAESCEDERWNKILSNIGKVSNDELSNEWMIAKNKCEVESFFEFRHALIYIYSSDFDKANLIIDEALSSKLRDYRFVYLAKAQMYYAKWLKTRDDDLKHNMFDAYKEIITRYPEWYVGYERLGNAKYSFGEYSEAIELLEKSINKGGSYASKVVLVATYYQMSNYEKAISFVPEIIKNHPPARVEKTFMLSAAWSFFEANRFMDGQKVLLVLMEENPNIKNDPDFINAVGYLKTKIEEMENNNEAKNEK